MADPTPQGADLPALLGAASGGDDRAWRMIVHLYARRVFALVKSRLHREHLAEEITQSVFCTVASKLSSGQYVEHGRFEAWLFRIAMNRVRDEVRRSRHRPESADPSVFDRSPAESVQATGDARDDDTRALREALGALAEADREVVELRHHAGMSFKHIADLLEQPLGTVLARHHRALKKLRELLGSVGAGGEE